MPIGFENGLPRRPVGPPYPFCPFGTFPLDKGNRPRNDRFFDRLGSPCGGAGTASAVTERAASLVKGRWHGAAVTEGFRPPESWPKNGIPPSASLPASPIPFVSSGHFPLIRGIGLSQGGQGTGITDCHVGPPGLFAMTELRLSAVFQERRRAFYINSRKTTCFP